ncbi:hypothetical protein [Lentilactobacillus laojiaonis]|uniref:hypothetical protein n=1 Tax=Lentilactobacillus laojiaonis TaxID=2883998 RepID=UPI001D0A5BA9|nr:hypothetical protein [Lentilactobacillus laojiaonis]UDM32255.1 hypothetical protein LHL71_00520 [Lentilactobacillus laojiaonis]
MENYDDWLINELKSLEQEETSFIQRAILNEAIDIVKEQTKRIEQAKGELDGRVWDKQGW